MNSKCTPKLEKGVAYMYNLSVAIERQVIDKDKTERLSLKCSRETSHWT